MKTEDVFPRKWLSGDDLPHDVGVTIERVVLEELRNPKTHKPERKPVAYFVGKKRGLILNVTNWKTLARLYGDESDRWRGRRVLLGPEEVEVRGERVRAVRVKGAALDPLPSEARDGLRVASPEAPTLPAPASNDA
jgi:hypothetical protein